METVRKQFIREINNMETVLKQFHSYTHIRHSEIVSNKVELLVAYNEGLL